MSEELIVSDATIMEGRGKPSGPPVWVLLPSMPMPEKPNPAYRYMRAHYPKGDDHHIALGKFLNEWGNLEARLFELSSNVIGIDYSTNHAITSALGMKQTSNVISAVSAMKLKGGLHQRLVALLDRVAGLATKRNHIVHGRWSFEVQVNWVDREPVLEERWARVYHPPDMNIVHKIALRKSQKERGKYCFLVADISEATAATKLCHQDITLLAEAVRKHLGITIDYEKDL